MNYIVNGRAYEHASNKVADIILSWGAQPPFAIAVNKHFVPQHQLSTACVCCGDEIDIVSPIQGG